MADPRIQVHLVTPKGPILDRACIASLSRDIAAADASEQVCVDLSQVKSETPQGLAALLELASELPSQQVILCGLPRFLLASAIDLRLAELLPIFTGNPHRSEPSAMRALIYEEEGRVGAGWIDIAGRPLLVRQLQWLRDAGVEDVIVELCAGADDSARGAWLVGEDPLVSRASIVPSGAPLGAEELARRAGVAPEQRLLRMPAHVLAGGPVAFDFEHSIRLTLPLPAGVHAPTAALELRAHKDTQLAERQIDAAWGLSIEDLGHALDAACAVLEKRAPGIMLHALELTPGVWLARGAYIAPSARVEPPVLLGVGVLVLDGAQVGPRAVVLDGSVVERDAVVVDATVAANTLIGEGTRVRHALATPHAFVSFDDATRTSIIDSLVLTSRARSTTLPARAVAALLLLLLGPLWLVCAAVWRLRSRPVLRTLTARGGISWREGTLGLGLLDLVPPLVDVLAGSRDLLGVARENALEMAARRPHPSIAPRAGAIDLSGRLAVDATPGTLLRMWRWYARRKTNALDRALLLGRGRKG